MNEDELCQTLVSQSDGAAGFSTGGFLIGRKVHELTTHAGTLVAD